VNELKMNISKIWEMERSFWLEGAAFFEKSLAPDACMVFPFPTGILTRSEILEGLAAAPRWEAIELGDKTESHCENTLVLAYKATAHREEADTYTAFCSSTYVRGRNGWVLLAHQQTV